MRIGVLCHASFGGSARIGTELAAELARRGHRVHLFTRTVPFGSWQHGNRVQLHPLLPEHSNRLHPARLHTAWTDSDLQALIAQVLQVIRQEGLDVLHFHYAVPFAAVTAEVRRRLGAAAPSMIGTLHGTDVSRYGREPDTGPRLAAAIRSLDALTTVSQSHADLARSVFQLAEHPTVIPNFVDLARFRPRSQARSGTAVGSNGHRSPAARPRLIHISNFRPVKDPRSVAEIFLGIRERTAAELWLVGDGQEFDSVRAMFQANGTQSDVRYWGLQHDVAPILAQADLLLMTSKYESFCLAALEAMACGVPVIATEVGGLPEVVVHGTTGYLFPVGDRDRAVNLAVNLLRNPVRHALMRAAAVRHARRFGQGQIVSAYESLYRGLLNGAHGQIPARGQQAGVAATPAEGAGEHGWPPDSPR